jgi:Fe2+ transport system protein FeoA
MPTTLDQLDVGAAAKILQLQGGFGFQQQVRDLGLFAGQTIRKVEQAGTGPILIQFETQTVAVGRGIAKRIILDELSNEP